MSCKESGERRVVSPDGTTIAHDVAGKRPALVADGTVAPDRTALAGLAAAWARHFTVGTVDGRARGRGADQSASEPRREAPDLGAVIDAEGRRTTSPPATNRSSSCATG